jgi:hypothetical protein
MVYTGPAILGGCSVHQEWQVVCPSIWQSCNAEWARPHDLRLVAVYTLAFYFGYLKSESAAHRVRS